LTDEAVPTTRPTASFRAISAAELLSGNFLVIGHNVFRIVPNVVLIIAGLVLGIAD
jgi:hypothetical protein